MEGLRKRGPSSPATRVSTSDSPKTKSKTYIQNKTLMQKVSAGAAFVLSMFGCSCQREKKQQPNGDVSSLTTIKTRSQATIILLLFSFIFIMPLFLCAPEPIYEANPPSTPTIKQLVNSMIPSNVANSISTSFASWLSDDELPAPSTSASASTSLSSLPPTCPPATTFFHRPACSPICSTLYYGRRILTSSLSKLGSFLHDLADFIVQKTGIAPSLSEVFVMTHKPMWAIYRVGHPLLAALHGIVTNLIPANDRLMMMSTGFMQSAVLRAVSKLHLADIIHHQNTLTRATRLEQETAKVRGEWIGRETQFPLTHSELGVSIDTLAQASCASKPHLLRLLRAAQVLNVFVETPEGNWRQSPLSELLREDHPQSFKAAALMMGGEQYVALSSLHLSVMSGKPAFEEIYGDFWEYHEDGQREYKVFEKDSRFVSTPTACQPWTAKGAQMAITQSQQQRAQVAQLLANGLNESSPEIAVLKMRTLPYQLHSDPHTPRLNNVRSPAMFASTEFHKGMTSIAASAARLVAREGNFHEFDAVVDIAGGRGHLLREVLKTHSFVATGVVFDLPTVYEDEHNHADLSTGMKAVLQQSTSQGCTPSTALMKTGAKITFGSASNGGVGSGVTCDDNSKVCPRVYVETGSFFAPETIPQAHEYALPVLQHKLQKVASRLAGGRSDGVEVVSVGTNSQGQPLQALRLRHNAAYVMMQILHDWSDEKSVEILKNLHKAMTHQPNISTTDLCCKAGDQCKKLTVATCDGDDKTNKTTEIHCPSAVVEYKSKLYIVDRILEKKGNFISSQGSNFADVLMMNNFNDAKERYVEDMERILTESGYRMLRIIPTRSYYSIVEAEPIVL